MLKFRRKTMDEHYIDRGHVGCPRTGRDVEVDVCLACRFAEEVHAADRTPFVRCRPTRPFPL